MGRFKKILGAGLIILSIAIGIHVLGYIFRPVDTDGAFYQVETFHSLPENSIEVIVYGSSKAYRGLCTMELYKKYGIGAYNYGYHWQKINTTNLFIHDSLMTQKPKVALIETYYCNKVLMNRDVNPEIYYSRYIKDEEAKKAYLKQCIGDSPSLERLLAYRVPLALFHSNWNSLTKDSFKRLVPGPSEEYLTNMGYAPSEDVYELEIAGYDPSRQRELLPESVSELDKIVQYCRDNGIEVVFFALPWDANYQYNDAMEQYAEENGCVFLDLCKKYKEVGLDGKTDFSDYAHLNTRGSCKVADYIGQYLKDNYELTDMRNIDGNIWQKVLDE